jgi:uncharacterized membrane protein
MGARSIRHRTIRVARIAGVAGVVTAPLLVHAILATGRPEALMGPLAALSGLSHAALYSALLALFANTLRPPREDMVSGLARRVSGPPVQGMAAYTRWVTKAWCLFFAGQLGASALLLAFAPLAAWSLLVNVLDLPLVLLMFAAEYAYRLYRFRNHAHVSLATTIAAFAHRNRPL